MTEDPRQSSVPGLVAGFLVGASVGAIVALLFAPKPGRVMREELASECTEHLEQVKERLTQLKDDLANTVEAAQAGAREGAARMRQQMGLE